MTAASGPRNRSSEATTELWNPTGDSWQRFEFSDGDVRSAEDCKRVLRGADVVFHQAAMNSVPRSIEMPVFITDINVTGMVTLLQTAVDAKVPRFVYASSSSVYGNVNGVTRSESRTGAPLSPYGASKQAVEAYASCYHQLASIEVTGLRYFNVFGSRQNDKGPYSAVIPRWIRALIDGEAIHVYGDGEQRRDFTHVSNVVHANLIAYGNRAAGGETFNVGTGTSISLLELFETIRLSVVEHTGRHDIASRVPIFQGERQGDVRATSADIAKIRRILGYEPVTELARGSKIPFCGLRSALDSPRVIL
jgi:UDP-N-acetylglucosamine/UDP-N-acetylgalactosamine 4-epimerase